MTSGFQLYVGVDISAKTFTATWAANLTQASRPVTFDQSPEGYHAFQQQLAEASTSPSETLIVLEATGSYWIALAVTLHQAHYAVAVLHPNHVVHYARSLPRRGKTDALDAQLLLHFAVERQPGLWSPPPQVYHELRQRLVVRDGLLVMRTQARNQRHALLQWPVQVSSAVKSLDSIITDLTEQIDTLTDEIARVLTDGAWATSATMLASAPGIGVITTAWLLVGTLNFSIATSPEQLSAYVGLVPLPRESGTSVRGRASLGHAGHSRVRTALYMATLTAAQHNPTIQVFYQRLCAAGKPKKIARCAAARKLLHLAWALVKQQQLYRAPAPLRNEALAA